MFSFSLLMILVISLVNFSLIYGNWKKILLGLFLFVLCVSVLFFFFVLDAMELMSCSVYPFSLSILLNSCRCCFLFSGTSLLSKILLFSFRMMLCLVFVESAEFLFMKRFLLASFL